MLLILVVLPACYERLLVMVMVLFFDRAFCSQLEPVSQIFHYFSRTTELFFMELL